MSDFSEDLFLANPLYPELRDKRKPVSTEWKKGPRITKENLKKGTGAIELLRKPEWLEKSPYAFEKKSTGNVIPFPSGQKGKESVSNAAIFTFGKYKGRLFMDVLDEDPGYLRWCGQEIDGFEAKLAKAGIKIDEI